MGLTPIDYTQGTGEGQVRLDFYVLPQEKNAGTLFVKSFSDTASVVRMVWMSLYGLVTGQFSMNDVAGPVVTRPGHHPIGGRGAAKQLWATRCTTSSICSW